MTDKYLKFIKLLEMFNSSVSLPGIESLPTRAKTKEKRKFKFNGSKISNSRTKLLD